MRRAVAALIFVGAFAALDVLAAAEAEVAAFLERAQFWQARNRDDLARDEIEKALRVSPEHPDALAMQARMQLRANQDKEAAATLERLRKANPQHEAVKPLAAALRVRGPDKDKLRRARQLSGVGRNEEALKAFDAIFPDGFPDDDVALEYAQILGGTRSGWEQARTQMTELAKRHPGDARFQVALASHLARRQPVAPAVIAQLRELTKNPENTVSRTATESWRRAVTNMEPTDEAVVALREYIAANPGETAATDRLEEVTRLIAEEKRQRNDPGLRAKREGMEAFKAGRTEEADRQLQEAVALYPKDADAVGWLGLVRLRQGRHDEAVEFFTRASHLEPRSEAKARAKWEELGNTARFWGLLAQAGAARDAGKLDVAEARALEARALDPKEPAASAALARIYITAGRDREAEALLAQLSPEARQQVAASLEELRASRLRDEGRRLRDAGRDTEAITAMEKAAAVYLDDPWLRHDLARLYAKRGDAQRGDALFEDLEKRKPELADGRYAHALYLSWTGKDLEALAVLEDIPANERSEGATSLQRRLWFSVQGRRATALAQAGRPEEASRVLESMQAAAGTDVELALQAARVLRSLDRDAELEALVARIDAAGVSTSAQEAEVAEMKLALARRRADALMEKRDYAAAKPLVEAALAASPNDPNILGDATRLAMREDRLDDAVAYERRALAADAREGDAWRYRRLAEMLDRQLDWYATGLDWLYRSGTPGKSQVSAQELPLGFRQGWKRDGQWLFKAAPARVASGTLDLADSFETSTYGTLLLCQPNCGNVPLASSEKGLAVGAGYENEGWRADLGSSPIGFPVVNVVGGVAHSGYLGPLSYTLDLSRRAMPSSQLSYAGLKDPNTGRTWGGVVTNGLRLNLSRDSGGDYGAWGVAGLYRLTGKNVQDNDKAELMAGFYRRFINEDDRLFTAGLTTMFWHFSENAGEYTFGHGGYYSPKTYRSVSLPLSYGVRTPLMSLWVRASVSVAWSESRRAPFFPTDAALQAQAEAIAPVTGVDPFYSGGSNGRSYGRSFAAAGERQIAPGIFFGGRIDIERSTNYTPSRFLLYFRFTPCEPAARPVALPPEPGLPGFQY